MTSKVVNMAPCSDRKEGKKEVMMMEGRKERGDRNRKIDYKVTARKRSTVKGQLEGYREQVIISMLPCKVSSEEDGERGREKDGWMDCST